MPAQGRSAYDPPMHDDQVEDITENATVATGDGSRVQQHDDRGHPLNLVSRFEAREARRAQNNVLSTIGVCEGIDEGCNRVTGIKVSKARMTDDDSKVELIRRENEVGLALNVISSAVMAMIDSVPQSVRYKVEVSLLKCEYLVSTDDCTLGFSIA